jgi:hypothetical protein
MLRYYDDAGLVKPDKIDEFTGYRYYSESQLPAMWKINTLKDMVFGNKADTNNRISGGTGAEHTGNYSIPIGKPTVGLPIFFNNTMICMDKINFLQHC